jgi:RsiW-degrading membrane proteinase PrsW (M82 family)
MVNKTFETLNSNVLSLDLVDTTDPLNIADIVANTYNEFNALQTAPPVAPVSTPPIVATTPQPTTMQNLGTAIGSIAGNVGGTFLGNLVNGMITTAPNAVTNQLGTATSTVADSAIVAFWKKHKTTIIVLLITVPVAITLLVKFVYNKKSNNSKKW